MGSLVSVAGSPRRGLLVVLAAVVALVCGCTSATPGPTAEERGPDAVVPTSVIHEGAPGPDDDFPTLPSQCVSPTEIAVFKPCHVTDFGYGRPTMAVWGDSHAWMYLPALKKAAEAKRVNLVMILAGGCPPALPEPKVAGQPYTECETHDTRALQYVRTMAARTQPFGVILGAFWTGYRGGYKGGFMDGDGGATTAYDARVMALAKNRVGPLFDALGKLRGVDVDVIGQAATVPVDPAPCAAGRDPYQCDVPRASAMAGEASTKAWLEKMMGPLNDGARYIDPSAAYCDATACHPTIDGDPTWYDDLHLGKAAASHLWKYFTAAFDDLA